MMRLFNILALTMVLLGTVACSRVQKEYAMPKEPLVKLGVERLMSEPEYLALVRGKNVGLVTNPTGVNSELRHTIDLLHNHPEINLVKLYAPEHGVRGEAYAGEHVDDSVDAQSGAQIISLYGANRRPSAEALEGVDIMLYDIQDIGSRSYTYIYTMAYVMEGCAEAGIPFVVLDRPNPAGADYMDGNVLNMEEGTSFVGLYAIPYMYGMTPGETAKLFNKEFNRSEVDLTVVPMTGYRRDMRHWDTGLPFVPTSTHIPSARHGVYYNLTGIVGELNTVSIGVGYTLPFEVVAAPWIDPYEFTEELRSRNLEGIKFRPISFRPKYHHFEGEMIHGVQMIITDYERVRPVTAQMHIMTALQELYPEQDIFGESSRSEMFDKVMGTKSVRRMLREGASAQAIMADWDQQLAEFRALRRPYLMY